MIQLLALMLLGLLAVAAFRGVLAGFELLLQALVRLGGAFLVGSMIWALLKLLSQGGL